MDVQQKLNELEQHTKSSHKNDFNLWKFALVVWVPFLIMFIVAIAWFWVHRYQDAKNRESQELRAYNQCVSNNEEFDKQSKAASESGLPKPNPSLQQTCIPSNRKIILFPIPDYRNDFGL